MFISLGQVAEIMLFFNSQYKGKLICFTGVVVTWRYAKWGIQALSKPVGVLNTEQWGCAPLSLNDCLIPHDIPCCIT